jgi:type II secretory pathway pseudopilin PulG
MHKFISRRGISLIEMMVALAMTGFIATASFQFYAHMHGQAEAQIDLSEAQHLARNTMHEIRKTTRMAGFKLSGHDAYTISGDSFYVFAQLTQPVDTVLYYLDPFTDDEREEMYELPEGQIVYKLMKQVNSDDPMEFADLLNTVTYTVIDTSTLSVTVTAQTPRSDEDYDINNGYRTFTLTERIHMRNVN